VINIAAAKKKAERAGGKTLFPELASVSVRNPAELAYLVRREEFENKHPARRVPLVRQLQKWDLAVESAEETRDTVEEHGSEQVTDPGDEIQTEGDQQEARDSVKENGNERVIDPGDDVSELADEIQTEEEIEIAARNAQRALDEQRLLAEIKARRLKRKGRSDP
jgi:hypothetical protein